MADTKEALPTEGTEPVSTPSNQSAADHDGERPKRSILQILKKDFLTFGSASQIITAALLAIAIGMAVSTQVDDVPVAAIEIISIPGDLWLRALKAVGEYLHPLCPNFVSTGDICITNRTTF